MADHLLIESRDPFDHVGVAEYRELAVGLRERGEEVTYFLVENGVLAARRSKASEGLAKLTEAGVKVVADGFSLRERGIPLDRLAPGVETAEIDLVVDRLGAGARTQWH